MTVTLSFDCSIGIGRSGGMRLVGSNLNAASAALVLPLLLEVLGFASEPADAIPALVPSPAEPDEENEPGGHVCPDCGKTCSTAGGLGVHRSRAHPKRPKKPETEPAALHICHVCGKGYKTKNGVLIHFGQNHRHTAREALEAAEAAPPVPVDPEPAAVTQSRPSRCAAAPTPSATPASRPATPATTAKSTPNPERPASGALT